MSDDFKIYLGLGISLSVILLSAAYIYSSNAALDKKFSQEHEDRKSLEQSLLRTQPEDFTLGATDPEITLYIYTDTDCPFCRDYEPDLGDLLADFEEKVAITYRPIDLPIYPHSRVEHLVLECVGITAGATAYRAFQNDVLFSQTAQISDDYRAQILASAKNYVPADTDLESCIDSAETLLQLERKGEIARVLGVTQTPTTFFVARDGTTLKRAGNYSYNNLLVQIREIVPTF